MDLPATTITLDQEQAALIYDLIQRDIRATQHRMRVDQEFREPLRKRIVLGQAIRRQLPECYWSKP